MSRKSSRVSGWCRHNGHDNCIVCECACHKIGGIKIARRCGECGWRPAEFEARTGISAETGRCTNKDDCHTRVEANPTFQRYRDYQAHGEQVRAERGEETATRAGRPTAGVCQCGCEGPTKGGKFQPGHDAKLKGRLRKAAQDGDEEAHAELVDRGWVKA